MIGQVFWTVLSGTTVFVLGQIFVRMVLDPVHELQKQRGDIADALIFYANVTIRYSGIKQEELEKSQDVYRQKASQLIAKAHMLRFYWLWSCLLMVPPRKNIAAAARSLIGLSNNVFDNGSDGSLLKDKYRSEICRLLDLEIGT
jgi:hypothetical protein